MKIRIKFSKTGVMKFVGHLDTMRYFQRAIKRAGIDIAYTTGFSPHPIMSFALPLGVGVESEGEYFDIRVNSTESSKISIEKLNAQMSNGVEILSYKKLADDAKKSMSLVEAADYVISLRERYSLPDNFSAILNEFYSRNEIVITKQTKKSEREIDIKPLIFDLKMIDNDIFMRLKAGSVDNIKPSLVLEAVYAYIKEKSNSISEIYDKEQIPAFLIENTESDLESLKKFIQLAFSVKRLDLYTYDENNELIFLDETGETIYE